MSNTDRVRAYYNLHKKCFSVQDYKTGLVIEHTDELFVTNAMFVVRKSGNEKVKREGRKNVHAFVNGIRSKLKQGMMPEFASHKVRYDPHTMDYFHYERIVNGKPEWLPIDRHWIGNVYLYMSKGKPKIFADIDKLSPQNLSSQNVNKEPLMVIKDETCIKRYYENGGFSMEFLRKKQRQIKNKNKLLAI
jgi:hypothetical protein